MLGADDKHRIVSLYETRLARLGRCPATVGWGSAESQVLRFDQLFRGIDPRGCRILDVGCGLGDLVDFLDARIGDDFDYVGIDLAPALIDDARARLGGPRRAFAALDILDTAPPGGPFDLVVLSGALTFRIADNLAHTRAMLGRMFALSRRAVAANFLSTTADHQLDKNYHHCPHQLVDIATGLTRRFALYHDYPLHECTLHLFHAEEAS